MAVTPKSLALRAAVFGAAMAAAWGMKWTLRATAGSSKAELPPPAARIVPADPDDLAALDSRLALADALVDADAAKLKGIAEGLLGKPQVPAKVWHGVLTTWFKAAPAAAWEFASAHPERAAWTENEDPFAEHREVSATSLRGLAVEVWSRLDPRAARAALPGPEDPDFGTLVTGAMAVDVAYGFQLLGEAPESARNSWGNWSQALANLAALAPPLALDWADRLGAEDYYPALLAGWLHRDAKAAMAWLATADDAPEVLGQAVDVVKHDIRLYQPELLDLLIRVLPVGKARADAVLELLEHLAAKDSPMALREADRALADPELRAEAYVRITIEIAESDPLQAWKVLECIAPTVTGGRLHRVPHIEVIGTDGKPHPATSGLPTFGGFPNSPASDGASGLFYQRQDILDKLVRIDKDLAVSLMEKCPPGQLAEVGGSMLAEWARHDPVEAATWLSTKFTEAGDVNIDSWFGRHNTLTPEETRDLARSLPPGPFRDEFVAWTAGRMDQDPATAVAFARENGAADVAVAAGYGRWAADDGMAALESLAADTDAPPAAWEAVIWRLGNRDREAAVALAEKMAPGDVRDAVLKTLVEEAPRNLPPLQRVAWACGITDEATRRTMLDKALNGFSRDLRAASEPAELTALRESIRTAGEIPPAEKQGWLQRIETEFGTPP